MELSEAKKKAENIIYTLNEQIEESDYHNDCQELESIDEEINVIQTLLKALDNSIPKEKVRKLSNDAFEVSTREYGTLFVISTDNLQELLGE